MIYIKTFARGRCLLGLIFDSSLFFFFFFFFFFFLILLDDPLFTGFINVKYLLEWGNRLEDIFKLSWWGNLPSNLTGDKQI